MRFLYKIYKTPRMGKSFDSATKDYLWGIIRDVNTIEHYIDKLCLIVYIFFILQLSNISIIKTTLHEKCIYICNPSAYFV